MSTPSKPDDPDPATPEASGGGGTRTSTQESAPESDRNGDAESTTRVDAVEEKSSSTAGSSASSASETAANGETSAAPAASSGSASSETEASGGPAGPPPPWQRGGAAAGPPSGPIPTGTRPGGPPTPGGGQPRPGPGGPGGPGGAHPPSGPFPRPGGAGPQGPQGPQGSGYGRPPGDGSGTPSGGIPIAARTAPSPGSARPGGTGEGQGGPGTTSSSGIDAPTNQLSPEQLGLRNRDDDTRREPDDVAELSAGRPRSGKAPRRASLQVRRFDPWSVLKLALVLGVALFFVWMFAVGVLYAVLDGMGVWAQLNGTYQDLTSDAGGGGELITAGGVFGVAAVIGVVNIILFTALASVSAFIYNISADVAGGIEVTLSERD
ncbi:DUF3566 domain-containing protein [Actinomycetospora flava]|uniref:DUF3566 domain-containing protein n=1 Tax=Actinomycetospora flava TaxID=3129232 RepID=UPI00359FBB87